MAEIFLLQPFVATLLIALISSILGAFVLWKKISFFGDALSHSMILGIVAGIFFEISPLFSPLIFAAFFAVLMAFFVKNKFFSPDLIVMTLSYFCISLALVLSNLWFQDFNLNSFIWGDVLTAQISDIILLSLLCIACVAFVIFAFEKFLLLTISDDIAKIAGVKTDFWNLAFLFLLSVAIAFSVRIVGVFLMAALLIMPAAIARIYSVSPKQMLILSTIISLIFSVISFKVAILTDLPVSSIIILLLSIVLFSSLTYKKFSR